MDATPNQLDSCVELWEIVHALWERVPWRPIGTSIATLGIPAALTAVNPTLAEASAVTELAVALTIIGTALFGSFVLSERAFRLLRWIGNRPEPPAPPGRQGTKPGDAARMSTLPRLRRGLPLATKAAGLLQLPCRRSSRPAGLRKPGDTAGYHPIKQSWATVSASVPSSD